MYVQASSDINVKMLGHIIRFNYYGRSVRIDDQEFCFEHSVSILPLELQNRLYVVCYVPLRFRHKTYIIEWNWNTGRFKRKLIRMKYMGHSDHYIYLKNDDCVLTWPEKGIAKVDRWCLYQNWQISNKFISYIGSGPATDYEIDRFEIYKQQIYIGYKYGWKSYDLLSGKYLISGFYQQKIQEYLAVGGTEIYHYYNPNDLSYLPKPLLQNICIILFGLKLEKNMYIPKALFRFKILPLLLNFK